jgi:CO/xanthine dehydrogenase FAD-binding subunit
MRAYLPDYQAASARSLGEALSRLAESHADSLGRWQPLAGGTDLMVLFAAGKLPAGRYLDLLSVAELRGIDIAPEHVEVRALSTYTDVRYHPVLQAEFPSMVRAAAESGAVGIQNRGTIAGNIANASPAADTPPALLSYQAELELVSVRGARWLPYSEFHTSYKQTRRAPDELIARIRLPRLSVPARAQALHYYRKVGTRRAQAISKVCFSGFTLGHDETGRLLEPRVALGSVAPVPLRCFETERVLAAEPMNESRLALAQAVLEREIRPIDDIRSTRNYRQRVARNLLAEFVRTALSRPPVSPP